MLRILSLDPARTVGWAFAAGADEPQHGIYRLPSTFGGYGAYCRSYRRWLEGAILALHPTLIVYESPILPKKSQISVLRGLYALGTQTEEIAFERIECREVDAQEVRKHFLGAGKTPKKSANIKEAVIAECRRRGWKPFDHNAADALAGLDFVRSNRIPGFASRGLPLLQASADAA